MTTGLFMASEEIKKLRRQRDRLEEELESQKTEAREERESESAAQLLKRAARVIYAERTMAEYNVELARIESEIRKAARKLTDASNAAP